MFIASLDNCLDSTKATYATALRAIATKMGIETPLLGLLIDGLRAGGTATIPTRQATPASRSDVIALLDWLVRTAKTPRVAVGIYIMWKAASRYDDVLNLRKNSILLFDRSVPSIIIEWGQTKTNRARRFQIHNWTEVVELEFPQMLQRTAEVFSKLQDDESIFGEMTSTQLLRLIQKCPATTTLTLHSFKRGAGDHLMRLYAQDPKIFDLRLIPALLKHKDALNDFPASTLRYIDDKVNMARAFNTGQLTRHL